jgi:hypothetical protein
MVDKIIADLPAMGAFWGSHCVIRMKNKKIYCDCIGGEPQCDMSQAGFGMTAFCPLYGFYFDIEKERDKIKEYLEYLKHYKIVDIELIAQIAKSVQIAL